MIVLVRVTRTEGFCVENAACVAGSKGTGGGDDPAEPQSRSPSPSRAGLNIGVRLPPRDKPEPYPPLLRLCLPVDEERQTTRVFEVDTMAEPLE
jgi:hypothetical protein